MLSRSQGGGQGSGQGAGERTLKSWGMKIYRGTWGGTLSLNGEMSVVFKTCLSLTAVLVTLSSLLIHRRNFWNVNPGQFDEDVIFISEVNYLSQAASSSVTWNSDLRIWHLFCMSLSNEKKRSFSPSNQELLEFLISKVHLPINWTYPNCVEKV